MDADMARPALAEDDVLLAAEIFRMLADPTRVRLLWTLLNGEASVNELAATLGRPGPSVSQHLAKLRTARLVLTRRDGTSVLYRLATDHVGQLVTDALHHAEHATTDSPAHHRTPAEQEVAR